MYVNKTKQENNSLLLKKKKEALILYFSTGINIYVYIQEANYETEKKLN